MSKLKVYLYYSLGVIFLACAIVGAILPVLPTTPFLLLAIYFLNQVSPSLHQKILKLPLFGKALQNWSQDRVIAPRAKIEAIVLLSISTGYIWWFREHIHLYLKIVTTLTLLLIASFILKQKSSPQNGRFTK